MDRRVARINLLGPSSAAQFLDMVFLLSRISGLTMISRDGLEVWVEAKEALHP